FDVVVSDPPPPVEAAGSSVLYSEEFYGLAKQHLKTNGILQAWFPGEDIPIEQAIVRSLRESFPHVRCFHALLESGIPGIHMLASMEPIQTFKPEQLAATMPIAAGDDLLEWSYFRDLPASLCMGLSNSYTIKR